MFLSSKYLSSLGNREVMRKLNNSQLRWIIRGMKRGEFSVYHIARQQGITPRYIRILMKNTVKHLSTRLESASVGDKFFNERDNMKHLFLPPYSPDLNLEEYVHTFYKINFSITTTSRAPNR